MLNVLTGNGVLGDRVVVGLKEGCKREEEIIAFL
jgi:hypothetical protein